jgi:DNA-binding FadR family transcriptional regulator
MLNLIVDRNHFIGMQTQIASQIAALIRSGMLPPGEILPSETALAQHHEISRNVVREAYQILKNKKLVKSVSRREGTVVCEPSERGASFVDGRNASAKIHRT